MRKSSLAGAMVVAWLLSAGCGGSSGEGMTKDAVDAAADEAGGETGPTEVVIGPDAPDTAADEDAWWPEWKDAGDAGELDGAAELPVPQCTPGEGCFLDPCTEGPQCESGWCVEHLGDMVCSQDCVEECPAGWSCHMVASEPDVVYVCLSSHARLCRPCTSGVDCKSLGMESAACVGYGPQGDFCGAACGPELACPPGYSCKETASVEGVASAQCVADAGECVCTDLAVVNGLWTACEKATEWGTCEGKRFCTAYGLTECDAAVPAQEACDGEDNNCDGLTDEGFPNADGDVQANCVDPDDDNDGAADAGDNCPLAANPDQADADADGFGDACDFGCWLGEESGWETDCDGVPNDKDLCPNVPDPLQLDTDADGLGDECDPDDDGDGVPDALDNCALVFNPGQADKDADGEGDACDGDQDGDGVLDGTDNCPAAANADQLDTDGDLLGDVCDTDDDGDGDPDTADCAALDPTVSHSAAEECNGGDDDCDGQTDEAGAGGCTPWYLDMDGDGYGADSPSKCLCGPEELYTVAVAGDCGPFEPEVNPAAVEACNGEDDDCDGEADEGYPDLDQDGVADCTDLDDDGDGASDYADNCPLLANPGQADHDADDIGDACDADDDGDLALDTDDCAPLDPTVFPAAAEACDGKDNDCDGETDEGLGLAACGLGACAHSVEKCEGGKPQACDPFAGAVPELCDGEDNDCDGDVDETFPLLGLECDGPDADKGKHGTYACAQDGKTLACADETVTGIVEACNGVDDDCDGVVPAAEADTDGDGARVCAGDCDDSDPAIYPLAPDAYGDGIDQNCDGKDGDAGAAFVTVTVLVGGKPVAAGLPVLALLVPGDLPTGIVVATNAQGKAAFPLLAGITYRFRAVVGNVVGESEPVVAPGQTTIVLPEMVSFQVKLMADGVAVPGVEIAAFRHDVDPQTGKASDVDLKASAVTGASGLASFSLVQNATGFRFRATVYGYEFTSAVFTPADGDVLLFDVGAFKTIAVTVRSGMNAGVVGGQTVKAYRHEVDPKTGEQSNVLLKDAVSTLDKGVATFTLPASPSGYTFEVPDLYGYSFWSALVPADTVEHYFALPGFTEVRVVVTAAGTPLGGTKVQALNHRERLAGADKADDVWDEEFTALKDGAATFVLVDNASYGQPAGGWEGKGYRFRVPSLLGFSFTTEVPFVAAAYTYPPTPAEVAFALPGFANTTVRVHHKNVPVSGVVLKAWRVVENKLTGKRTGELWATMATDPDGKATFLMPEITANVPADSEPVGLVWQAPDVKGWSFVSHAQVPNLWCETCPPDAGGALSPHFFNPVGGYPPVSQEDEFEIAGLTQVTVTLKAAGIPVTGTELRAYRVRQFKTGTKQNGDHWTTANTDNQGKATFTLPDPAHYQRVEDWSGTGFVWYAPNVGGYGYISHAQVANLWCETCPPESGGALNPHVFVPQVGYPPVAALDDFAIGGQSKVTVTLTSAGVPVPWVEVRAYRVRQFKTGTKKYGDHWVTQTTDEKGKVTFTLADPAAYSQVQDWTGIGFVWYATNVEGYGFLSHAQIANIWCETCLPQSAGALVPHIFVPVNGYPAQVQNDSFAIGGFAKVTVTLTSAGKAVPWVELRNYRVRQFKTGDKKYADHWATVTTDEQGKGTFTVPDPATYSQMEDWNGIGFVWYATNIEGYGFLSHAQMANIWCETCPADAAGATEPHITNPAYGFPPTVVADPFKIVGFAKMTVVTSAGNDGTTMRLYSHRNTGQDDHWASYTISGGKAVFTAPDNSVYGKTATYYGTGWRFYREKDGGWSSVVTTPFAYPPAGSTFNF